MFIVVGFMLATLLGRVEPTNIARLLHRDLLRIVFEYCEWHGLLQDFKLENQERLMALSRQGFILASPENAHASRGPRFYQFTVVGDGQETGVVVAGSFESIYPMQDRA